MRHLSCTAWVLWLLGASSWAIADVDPIPYRNVSTMAQIVGLPRLGGGRVLGRGTTRMRLIAETANDFSGSGSLAQDGVSLDGETSVFTLVVRHGIFERLDVGMEIPYVVQSGGGMDALINNWHDLLGLNEGGRNNAPSNQLRYLVVEGGQPVLDLQSRKNGMGDVRLLFDAALLEGARSLALRGSVKFSNGEEQDLIGSGGTDYALSLAYTDTRLIPFDLVLSAEAGLVQGGGDTLVGRQEQSIYFGGVSLVYPRAHWDIKGTISGHSRVYDSTVPHLGDDALQGAVGVSHRFSEGLSLEGAVIEDLKRNTTADVTFQLVLTATF